MPIFPVSKPEEVKEASRKIGKITEQETHNSSQKNKIKVLLHLLLNSNSVIQFFSRSGENLSTEIQQLLSQSDTALHVYICTRAITSTVTTGV
jgi:hypothetical protein